MITIAIKKTFSIIIILSFFISCKKRNEEKIKFYPNEEEFSSSKRISKLNIEKLSFVDICKVIEDKSYQDSISYVEIINGNTLKKIILTNTHPEARSRNLLTISNDSIFIDGGHEMKTIEYLMRRHYENNGRNQKYPINAKLAAIQIKLRSNSSANEFINILNLITSTFDDINKNHNDTLKLNITLKRPIPSPPSPPDRY